MKLLLYTTHYKIYYLACNETGALVDQGEVYIATELLELPTLAARFIGEPLRVFTNGTRLSFKRVFGKVERIPACKPPTSVAEHMKRELVKVRELAPGPVFDPDWHETEYESVLRSNWEIDYEF